MTRFQLVKHQVAVAGWVIDVTTGKPIAGAHVTITAMPAAFVQQLKLSALQYGKRWNTITERLDKTRTREDGLFWFVDLPDGKYTFGISAVGLGKRYDNTQETATVSRDAQGNLGVAVVKASLRPTTVKGKITAPNHKTGVVLAEVRIKGSGERTFSDTQGQYVLAGIEPGTRTVQVIARGYKPTSQIVKLAQAGSMETLNVVLARDAS